MFLNVIKYFPNFFKQWTRKSINMGMEMGWGKGGGREKITFCKLGQLDIYLQVNYLTIFYIGWKFKKWSLLDNYSLILLEHRDTFCWDFIIRSWG